MVELPPETSSNVETLSARAEAVAAEGRYREALALYREALAVLPPPAHQWEAFEWLQVAVADAEFLSGRFVAAREVLAEVLKLGTDATASNPFIQLRYGQALLEIGDPEQAAQWLSRAFLSEGDELFANEDPKYLRFVQERLRPPDGAEGWGSAADKKPKGKRSWWKLW
jgi:tetratricopeptide (TPR) repeat protein